MDYIELLEIYRNASDTAADPVHKILSPAPLENPEDLVQIVSSRFRYTGPGKWTKIIRDFQNSAEK